MNDKTPIKMEIVEGDSLLQHEQPDQVCNVCGKIMTDKKTGHTLIGRAITLICDNEDTKEFYQKQMGEYELGKRYCCCWECWLKSIGFVP